MADVLFGDYNPAGRLPVTFYKSVADLPPFEEYAMAGRTYRYCTKEVLYPFGYGLSYTQFAYSRLTIRPDATPATRDITVGVDVTNVGHLDGDEVAQLYVSAMHASVPKPIRHLEGFRRLRLKPGETKHIEFTLTPYQLSLIDAHDKRVVERGEFRVSVGGGQMHVKSLATPPTSNVVEGTLHITGDVVQVE